MKHKDDNALAQDGQLPATPFSDVVPIGVNGSPSNAPAGTPLGTRALPPFRSIEELAAAADAVIQWVWCGVLAPALVTMLIGKPKKGKSTLTYALLAALEQGRTFLGLETALTTAILITEEATATVLQKCQRFGLKGTRCWTRADRVIGASFADILKAAVDEALRVGARVVVVDTLAGWAGMGPDAERDAGHGQAVFELLQAAAQRGVAILVVHHARKAVGEEADVARGSGALVGAADVQVQIAVAPNGEMRTLTFIGRADETPDEIHYELMNRQLEVVSEKTLRQRTDAQLRDKVLAALKADRGLRGDELREAVHAKKPVVDALLRSLADEGVLHTTGTGTRGKPRLFWKGPAKPKRAPRRGANAVPRPGPPTSGCTPEQAGDLGFTDLVPPIQGGTGVRSPTPCPEETPDPTAGPESVQGPESAECTPARSSPAGRKRGKRSR